LFRTLRERVRLSDRSFGQLWLFAGSLDLIRGADPTRPFSESHGHVEVFHHVARSPEELAFVLDRTAQQIRGWQHSGDL
jgi:hypothetical protein